MALSDRLNRMQKEIKEAFDDYCDELLTKQKGNLSGDFTGVLDSSMDVQTLGELHSRVGVNLGVLLADQWNVTRVNYADYHFNGHREVNVPFRHRVPNSKQSKSTGYWWHKFPQTGGYTPISDAVDEMGSVADYIVKRMR